MSNGLEKPIVKDSVEDAQGAEHEELLKGDEVREFRGLAARANYLSMDRPDMQFAAREVCR